MGKRGRGGGRGRGRGGGRGGNRDNGERQDRRDYPEVPKTNVLYEKYYKEGGFLPEDQHAEFFETLRRTLPNSFRFTGSKGHALPVLEKLKSHYIPHLKDIVIDGAAVDPPTPLPWYPNEMGWQMTTPKTTIRRFPPFAKFQKFLVSETGVGNISRQEVVSMIPPMVLDVHPGMTVLDLCAAPGSKTAQLIEMVHGGEEARIRKVLHDTFTQNGDEAGQDGKEYTADIAEEEKHGDWSDYGRSTGLVVANDVDYKRSHLLIHQTKRLNSPNIVVMNHDATQFPSIKIASEKDAFGHTVNKYLKFDRILADVPCSGDGTPRKNPNVWKDWTPGNSHGLHPVQARILVRALQMLKVGGRVVYSTCSMHPVENEAVVASCINRCGGLGKVELLDTAEMLPGLKRTPGLKSWKVMDKSGRLWSTWEDIQKQKDEGSVEGLGKLTHTMFADYVDADLPLERCMRVYPHQQDTGGFFIAVLEKKGEIKARPEGEAKRGHATEAAADIQTEQALEKAEDIKKEDEGSIMAIVSELEQSKPNAESSEHIKAADKILPPVDPEEVEVRNSVVKFEHPVDDSNRISSNKRFMDDPGQNLERAKKVKIHGELGFSAHQSLEPEAVADKAREVHFPPPVAVAETTTAISNANDKPKKRDGFFEEPFKFLPADQAELQTIYEFYGLDSRFPRDRFMVRNDQAIPSKAIYYTTELAKAILQQNEGQGFKFVHCGIKAFVKQDVPRPDVCRWRIQTDGMSLLEPWVKEERKLRLKSKKTFHRLLIEMFPKVSGDSYKDLHELGEKLREADLGCHVLIMEPGTGEDAFEERMVLPLWRSLASVNLMLPKEERKAMLLRLYNDTSSLIDHSNTSKQKIIDKAAEAAQADAEMPDQVLVIDDEEAEDPDNESDGGVPLNGETHGDALRDLETHLGEVSSGIDERYAAEQVTKAI